VVLCCFHEYFLGTLQVLLFAPCLRPHRAENKEQIKAQLGGMPVRRAIKKSAVQNLLIAFGLILQVKEILAVICDRGMLALMLSPFFRWL